MEEELQHHFVWLWGIKDRLSQPLGGSPASNISIRDWDRKIYPQPHHRAFPPTCSPGVSLHWSGWSYDGNKSLCKQTRQQYPILSPLPSPLPLSHGSWYVQLLEEGWKFIPGEGKYQNLAGSAVIPGCCKHKLSHTSFPTEMENGERLEWSEIYEIDKLWTCSCGCRCHSHNIQSTPIRIAQFWGEASDWSASAN